jgi:hypothetical protein
MVDEKERLQSIHISLEAALEQLTYAQQAAAMNTEIGQPSAELQAIEKVFGELTQLRNKIRDKMMKALSRPTLNVIK